MPKTKNIWFILACFIGLIGVYLFLHFDSTRSTNLKTFIEYVERSNTDFVLIRENVEPFVSEYTVFNTYAPVTEQKAISWSKITIDYSGYDLWEHDTVNGREKILVPHCPEATAAYYMREALKARRK